MVVEGGHCGGCINEAAEEDPACWDRLSLVPRPFYTQNTRMRLLRCACEKKGLVYTELGPRLECEKMC